MSVEVLEECKERLNIDEKVVASIAPHSPAISSLTMEHAITVVRGSFDDWLAKALVGLSESELKSFDLSELDFVMEIQHQQARFIVDGDSRYRVELDSAGTAKKNIARVIRQLAREAATAYLNEMNYDISRQRLEKYTRRISNVLNKLLLDSRITEDVLALASHVRLIKRT